MAEVILMPRLGGSMTEGTLTMWHKKVGDNISKGDLLAEVETDKATMELESYKDGTLLHIGGGNGSKIQVNNLLAIIGKSGEDITSLVKGGNTGLKETPTHAIKVPSPAQEASYAKEEPFKTPIQLPSSFIPNTHSTSNASTTFFSYSSSDSEFALTLAKDIKNAGCSIWMDKLELKPGVRWAREVDKALHSCENFLVMLSPAAIESDNVEDEISYALEEKKRIIPIVIKECRIPVRLRSLQRIDFTKSFGEGLRKLIEVLDNRS